MSGRELPPGLARPAQRALAGAGVTTLEDLTAWTEPELRSLHGMGPKALALLADALDQSDLSFREG